MKPTFTIKNDERLMLYSDYLSNGHWLITRKSLNIPACPKPMKKLENLQLGNYNMGLVVGKTDDQRPPFENIIPKRDEYKRIKDLIGVKFRGTEISAYCYECEGFEISIQPRYVPLLEMGIVFAKEKLSPLLILSGDSLNDELIGVIMPMRL